MYCVSYCCFFKQKTAYEMRISDWSSDVCSSDLYCSTRSSDCGIWLACETAETAACTSTWLDTSLLCSAARSTSMMADLAASMFSSDVAICWPRNSKREISAPAVARASEMTLMAASIRDIAAAAEAAELTATEAMLRSEEHTSELQSLMR